ncbi:MAG: hypothetical protein SCALA702_00880 [Melioribacteraceae bacterium]|nr:MAG: hypothetical protein SCALA702_00880 [Melioribacteraceae bacterium]
MKNIILLLCVVSILYSQSGNSIIVYPKQNSIGASLDSKVTIDLENTGWVFDSTCILHCYGSHHYYLPGNSEIISGSKFVFTPIVEFSPGEEIWVSFGPILNTESGKRKTINWNFIIDVPHTKSIKFAEPTYNSDLVFETGAGLVDVDFDGDLDMMSIYGKLAINDGNGNFTNAELPELYFNAPIIFDFNNDGFRDKLIAYDGYSEIYLQNINGELILTDTIVLTQGVIMGDINNDNFMDFISRKLVGGQRHIFPVINNKDGTFSIQQEFIVTESNLATVIVRDMNNDFSLDLFTSYRGLFPYINHYKIWLNEDDTAYTKIEFIPWIQEYPQYSRTFLEPYKILDIDKNGLVDIVNVSTEEGGAIYYQNEPNNFICSDFYFWGNGGTEGVAAYGDLDGDGDLDMTQGLEIIAPEMGYDSPVYANWFEFGGDFKFGNRNLFPDLGILNDMGGWSGGILGDIDGDGDLDYIFPGKKVVVLESVEVVGIEIENQKLAFVSLSNYPNPFNSSTNIEFSLVKDSNIRLEVFNILGQKIMDLKQGPREKGHHNFRANFGGYPSSIYIVSLTIDGLQYFRKIIYQK